MKRKMIAGILLAVSFGASRIAYRFYISDTVAPFDMSAIREHTIQDDSHIKEIFSQNFYALTANPDFDIDLMLLKNAPNKYERKYFGKMTTAVLLDNERPIGFVSYYMRSLHQGLILFLAIDKEYRGKGFSKKLLHYAMYQLKQKGAKIVKISTRSDNKVAQNLYSKIFTKEYEDNGFVHYSKKV